ncbi:MAG TPA: MFS transporter [Anaeromyxobacteraceae bacterium]|nr:MFS transporter [Anaeromyxobacteraceae bacterium]
MLSLRASVKAAAGGLSSVFWTLWWGLLVNRMASFVVAFLALYLVRDRGFSAAAAGWVVSLYGIGVTVAGPLGGLLADRLGRRATMVGGLAAGALAVAALALARHPVLLSALAFSAAATGDLYRPAMAAAVADVVPPPDRTRAFGLVYWAVNLGLAFGLLVAGLFADRSLPGLFLADAGTTAVFATLVLLRVPETRPLGLLHEPALRGLARVFGDGPFAAFLALHLVALVIFSQWQLGLPLDMAAHGLGPGAYAVLMAVNCAGVVLLQPLLAPWLRRFDGARLLAISALLFGLGHGANALEAGLPGYAVGTALWTVGEVIGFPVASALVADLAPADLRGRYQGAYAMTWGLALTLSPVFGGQTFTRLGGRALWIACLAIALLVAAGHLAAGGARRRRLAALGSMAPAEA